MPSDPSDHAATVPWADRLLADAQDALEQLESLVEQREQSPDFGDDQIFTAHRLFGECRFGFQQVLNARTHSTAATKGLTQAEDLIFEIEMASDGPAASGREGAAILKTLTPGVDGATTRAGGGYERPFLADIAPTAEVRAELPATWDGLVDGSRGKVPRIPRRLAVGLMVALSAMAVALVAIHIFSDTSDRTLSRASHLAIGRASLGGLLVAYFVSRLVRRTRRDIGIARVEGTVLLAVAFVFTFREIGAELGTSVSSLLVLEMVSFTTLLALIALAVDPRLLTTAPLYLVAAGAVLAFDAPAMLCLLLAHVALLCVVAATWGRRAQ